MARELTAITDPENDPVFEVVGICHACLHRSGLYTCKAFPEQIPMEIITGDFIHTEPYPGDNGVQFVRIIRGIPK